MFMKMYILKFRNRLPSLLKLVAIVCNSLRILFPFGKLVRCCRRSNDLPRTCFCCQL